MPTFPPTEASPQPKQPGGPGWRLAWLIFGALFLAASLSATTVNAPEFPVLVNESDYIVRAVVKSVTPELRVMPSGRQMPFTRVELEVKLIIAGKPPSPLILEVLGGMVGGRELSITGTPKFVVGEESILFVQGNGRQIYPLVRMAHGFYPIRKEAATGREYVVRSDGAPLRSVQEVSSPIHVPGGKAQTRAQASAQALTPDQFIQQIRFTAATPRLLEK